MFILLILVFIYLIVTVSIVFILISVFYSDYKGAPFVANTKRVFDDSLSFAKVTEKDRLCDIGSGDGCVLEHAYLKYGVLNLSGIEVSLWPYILSKIRFYRCKRDTNTKKVCKVNITRGDVFKYDLNGFTVIYAYLFPHILEKLSDKLFKFLKDNPNSRIVTPVFEIKWNKQHKKNIKKSVMKSYNTKWKKEVDIFLYTFKEF